MKNQTEKIALCIPSLRGGGVEQVFLSLAEGFLDNGYSVDLVLFQKKGPYLDKLDKRLNIIDLRSKRVIFGIFGLVRYLKKERPNSVLSAMPHVNIILLTARLLSQVKTNAIVTEHNQFSSGQNDVSIIKRYITGFLMRILYKKAQGVVAVSQGVADDLVGSVGVKRKDLHVIYNPIDIEKIQKLAVERTDHAWLSPKKKNKIILGVGRLEPQKDFKTLIRAFSKLEDQNAKLIILGEGKERKKLETLISDLDLKKRVALLGFVDNPYAYFAHANVFVLSSVYEGFGNVLVEAMACGIPVVSTDCQSGPSEILENGKYGILTQVGDDDRLAEAIALSLKSPNESNKLRRRAELFSKERAVSNYLRLMNPKLKN